METIKKWWAAHPISVHAIVGFIGTVTFFYNTVPAFKHLVLAIYSDLPERTHELVAAIVGIGLVYYKSGGKPTPPPPVQ